MLTLMIPMIITLVMWKWNYMLLYAALMIIPVIMWIYASPMMINISAMWALDYMSAMLILLVVWIMPLVLAASQKLYFYNKAPHQFMIYFSLLMMILIMSFSATNMFMFYILFEASLIPTLMIILKWGYQPERLQAGMYLMLYTITASLPLLVGITLFYLNYKYNMFTSPHQSKYPKNMMWIMMNTAFMVKLPLFALHLWLPKAHVEAPVAGSMILAAILLKLGGYGMLRLNYLIPPITTPLKSCISSMTLWGGMITSLICVRQPDMKSLIAYSSVGHMSLVMSGVLMQSPWALWGSVTMMIAHGLVSSALFAMSDMTYSQSNSRSMMLNKGMNLFAPTMSMLWFIMCAANMAAPPSINLLGEIMLISSTSAQNKFLMIPLALMSFLAGAYSLMLYISMNHGPLSSFMSHNMMFSPRNFFIILMHIIPAFLIILMPTIITAW